MRKLIYGMNLTVDGYVAAPGDDLGWSGPSDELFQWWLDQERAIGLLLYGRKLWEAMSSYWPTGDQQPNATPAQIEFARNWRDTPKVVFSSALEKVDWNTRLVTGDAVAEITRLKAEDGEPMRVGGATLAGAAMRAGLIDEYTIVTHPVLVGGGTSFFTALDSWMNLNLVETRTFPRRGGSDQVRDKALDELRSHPDDRTARPAPTPDRTRVCSRHDTRARVSPRRTVGEWDDVRERLVAWAEDCRVQGEVDLDEGRLSDLVNDRDVVVFYGASLTALEDGHELSLAEVEVDRRELSLIEVEGRRGDPERRLRTIREHVRLEAGPYTVTGYLHRSPNAQSLNALTHWSRFMPVTDADVELDGSAGSPAHHEVVLVNRDKVRTYQPLYDPGGTAG